MPPPPSPRVLLTLAVVLILLLGRPLEAWDGTGHQIICLIAEDHLSPNARTGITLLLGDARITDAEVASWADDVR